MAGAALIVIDVQNDFCPGGALAVADGDEILPRVNQLIATHDHVVLTQDWHPAGHSSFASSHPGKAPYETVIMPYGEQTLWPDHCIQNSFGSMFHAELNIIKARHIVRKGFRPEVDSYSAFFENDHVTPTGLGDYLAAHAITSVTMCGLATDYCVAFSALDAFKLGIKVTVDLTACRGINLGGSLPVMLATMQAVGITLREG
jgi:nicotinamidase/pyrazinamidase